MTRYVVLVFALVTSGCVHHSPLVTPSHDAKSAIELAHRSNWYVRVQTAGDMIEGRIIMVFQDSVRIGRSSVALGEVTSLARRSRTDADGAKRGALIDRKGEKQQRILREAACSPLRL